jgi:guanylate kinase
LKIKRKHIVRNVSAYYYNNKEKVRQRYAENREKILEYNAQYYQRMKKQDMENEKAYVNVFKPPEETERKRRTMILNHL